MPKFTNEQRDILFNLLIQEQRNIHEMNGNIQPLLEEYKKELGNILKIICDNYED